jgi:hypothetical protein
MFELKITNQLKQAMAVKVNSSSEQLLVSSWRRQKDKKKK